MNSAQSSRAIDLHMHTVISDGAHAGGGRGHGPPGGLRVIAITDHDALDAIAPARAAAGGDLG